MNRLIMTLGVIVLPIFLIKNIYSLDARTTELSIFNESDTTVLITYSRCAGAPTRSKLLETGELINFGRVYEASVQSYSTLWGYIAPGKQTIYSVDTIKKTHLLHEVFIRIKGITGRGLFHPFGQWDFQLAVGKPPAEMILQTEHDLELENIVDAFPTAKRKIMFTPRYILGLPAYADLEDAIEATAILAYKWHHIASHHHEKFTTNIIYLIETSKKEFEYGKGDVPLHIPIEMRSRFGDPQNPITLAWS